MAIVLYKPNSSVKKNIKSIYWGSKDKRIGKIVYINNKGSLIDLYRLSYIIKSNITKDTAGTSYQYIYEQDSYAGKVTPSTGYFYPKTIVVSGASLYSYSSDTGNFILKDPIKGQEQIILTGDCRCAVTVTVNDTGTYSCDTAGYDTIYGEGDFSNAIAVTYNGSVSFTITPDDDKGYVLPTEAQKDSLIHVTSGSESIPFTYNANSGVITLSNIIKSPIKISVSCYRSDKLAAPTLQLTGDELNLINNDERTETYEIDVDGINKATIANVNKEYTINITANNVTVTSNTDQIVKNLGFATVELTANNGYTFPTSMSSLTINGATPLFWLITEEN